MEPAFEYDAGTVPIETIKCRECGSPDITEFKPGSYVCGHCEAVFKHIDPTRVMVTVAAEYCACGKPVEVQCVACGLCTCTRCELQPGGAWVAVPAGGYRFKRARVQLNSSGQYGDDCGETLLGAGLGINGKPRRPSADEAAIWIWSGLLYTNKVRKYIELNGPFGHMCDACVAKAGEQVASALAAGLICANPHCAQPSSTECPCCHEPSCEDHLSPGPHYSHRSSDPGVYRESGWGKMGEASPDARDIRYMPSEYEYGDYLYGAAPIVAPAVCDGCRGEFLLSPSERVHVTYKKHGPGSWRQDRAKRAAIAEAERRAQAVADRWLVQLGSGRCLRSAGHLVPMRNDSDRPYILRGLE